MTDIATVFALWKGGFLHDADVVAWADAALLANADPGQALIDLSLNGPARCARWAERDFPPNAARLTGPQAFALHALLVDLDRIDSVLVFATAAASAAMGGDLEQPEVQLGYELDHLLDDCGDPQACVARARAALPPMLPACRQVLADLLPESHGLPLRDPSAR